MIEAIPLYIASFTATALVFLRKTFSYYSVGGIYAIEFLMIAAFAAYVLILMLRDGRTGLSLNTARISGLFTILAFCSYSFIRAAFSRSLDLQNLIPGIYPAYIVVVLLFALRSDRSTVVRLIRYFAYLVALSPLVPYAVRYALEPALGPIQSPGWTYLYAVSAAVSVFYFDRIIVRLLLFVLSVIGAFVVFERATFVNIALVFFVMWRILLKNPSTRRSTIRIVRYSLVLFLVALLAFPLVYRVFFSGYSARFDVTLENLVGFFTSIFKSDVHLSGAAAGAGVSGTRNHRLIMWGEALSRIFSNPFYILFGVGYHDTVAQSVSFRNVHNGYITIFYRNGLVGLGLFSAFVLRIISRFKGLIRDSADADERKSSILGLIMLGGILADALTGTIIDSPFTSFIAYAVIGMTLALPALQSGKTETADEDPSRP